MQEYIQSGDAGWSIQYNTVIQSATDEGYWISGGELTPGSSATAITVSVAPGKAHVNGTGVEWAGAEVELAAGGVGPSGTSQNEPRVDTIYVRQDSTLGVDTGQPAPYAPDTTPDGQPYQPAPFEHWLPAPDAGSGVGGVPLGFVLVEADDADAGDIPATRIRNFKIGGTQLSSAQAVSLIEAYDTTANGPVQTTVTNSQKFQGEAPDFYTQNTFTINQEIPVNTNKRQYLWCPKGFGFGVRRAGTVDATGASPPDLRIVVRDTDGTVLKRYNKRSELDSVTFAGNGRAFDIQFSNSTSEEATGIMMCEFVPQ